MKITGRLLNLGVVDKFGEMFAKDCEFTFATTVYVKDAGKPGIDHIEGTAVITHCGDHLDAELDVRDDSPSGKMMNTIKDRKLPMKLYPAVAGGITKRDGQTITAAVITSVDLTFAGNADETIPPLDLLGEDKP